MSDASAGPWQGRRLKAALAAVEDYWLAPADPRAYAALRIGYGVAALAVLADFWPLRRTLLGEEGLFGGARGGPGAHPLNLFLWAGSGGAIDAMTALAALAALAMILGVLPRVSAALVYLWFLSAGLTAPTAVSGYDVLLRVVGFVLVLGPRVSCWSVLPGAKAALPEPPVYGLRLVQWQLFIIYLSTVWLKVPDPFWRNGEAVAYFMMSMFARTPTAALAYVPEVSGLLTYGTLLIEVALPFLLWSPRWRWPGVFLGCSLHVGIALTSQLALFTLAILPLYMAFLERRDFDRAAALFHRAPP